MARRPKTEQKDSWKEILAKGFVGLCIRLLDRGQLVPFFMLIVTIGVFACMIILAVRIPGGDIGPFLGHLAEFFDSVNPPGWVAVLLPYSVLVNVFLVTVLVLTRKLYKAEIRRLGDAKSSLEKVIDPDRRGSGHDIGGD